METPDEDGRAEGAVEVVMPDIEAFIQGARASEEKDTSHKAQSNTKHSKSMKRTARYFDNTEALESDNKETTLSKKQIQKNGKKKKPVKQNVKGKGWRTTFTASQGSLTSETHDLTGVDFANFKGSQCRVQKVFRKEEEPKLREDPFPGDAPISKERIQKYKRGGQMPIKGIKTKYQKHDYKRKEEKHTQAARQAARTEILLPEQSGFLEAGEGEHTSDISQHEIAEAVDITSAQKFFELKLKQFGPYHMNYTRNGRFLLVGGRRGHVAAMDWHTKKLMCEVNAMETIQDVKWLHIETMFAVAQKQWTYVYDNQGIELHCLKMLDSVLRMEFLPYHFLLATGNAKGYMCYLDISVGQKVAGFPTGLGRLDVMCQNPSNAIIHLGHSGGTVTLWSPNVKEALVKMLCHGGGTRSLTVDQRGHYMATSGIDRTLKIWDLRMLKLLHSCKLGAGASNLSFSQRGLLAAGIGNIVQVYQDPCNQVITAPYMSHRLPSSVQGLQFCPYEDVLGVGHGDGFSSLLIPGAGEPNYDALEANPYQTKKQRQQAEVKMLLEKIQPDMISLDTSSLGRVDEKTLQEKMEDKKNILYLRPEKVDFTPKYKKKGRSKAGKVEQRKQGVQFEKKRAQIKDNVRQTQKHTRQNQQDTNRKTPHKTGSVLDRFTKADV